MAPELDVTVCCVNYKTPQLTKMAVESLRRFYPDIALYLADNGSNDASREYVQRKGTEPRTRAFLLDTNIGHGPALHRLIKETSAAYILTWDSDCEMLQGGVIEAMLECFAGDPKLYAVGWLRHVNMNGVPFTWHVPPPDVNQTFYPYIHPYCALYDRAKYMTLTPFIDHGAPALNNMRDAAKAGYTLAKFPKLRQYVTHWEAGTRRMFDGHWHPASNVAPKPWDAKQTFPI